MDENLSRRQFIQVFEVGGVTVTLAGGLDVIPEDLDAEPTDTTMQARDGDPNVVDRQEPMKTGRFEVLIDGERVEGWQSVTIPGKSIEQDSSRGGDTERDPSRGGDDPEYEKKTWGQPTFDDLEMERGVEPGATELWDWIKDIQAGKADEGRKEIAVKLKNEEGDTAIHWEFMGAWIKNYEPPDLDASADGEVATESATISFDTMERVET